MPNRVPPPLRERGATTQDISRRVHALVGKMADLLVPCPTHGEGALRLCDECWETVICIGEPPVGRGTPASACVGDHCWCWKYRDDD